MSKRDFDYNEPLYQTRPQRGTHTAEHKLYCYVEVIKNLWGGDAITTRCCTEREERNHRAGGVFNHTGRWPVSYFTIHEDGRIEIEDVCPKCGVVAEHSNDGICELCTEASTPPVQIEDYEP